MKINLPTELNETGKNLIRIRNLESLATTDEDRNLLNSLIKERLSSYLNNSSIDYFLKTSAPEDFLIKSSKAFVKNASEQADLIEAFIAKYLNKETFKLSIQIEENTVKIIKMIGTTYNKFAKDLKIEQEHKIAMKKAKFLENYIRFLSVKNFKSILESFEISEDIESSISDIYVSDKNYINFDITFSIDIKNLSSELLEELSYIISDINQEYDLKGILI